MARTYYAGTKRDKLIPVRVTEEEKQRIAADAKAAGLNTSDYVRAKALGPESDPEVAAVTHNLVNTLNGVENALLQARALLDGKE